MQTFNTILLIIIIIGLIAMLYITIYNRIQFAKIKIEKVESKIDEDLREKYDLIIQADTIIKDKINSKKDYLKEYRELKDAKISTFDMERKLKQAETLIITLCNDNDVLNNNDEMQSIIQNFKFIDEKITAGISYYNNHTSLYNEYVRKLPNNLVAKLHHIKEKQFFDGKDMTDTDINDFKL